MFHDYSFQLFMNPVREKYVICVIECDNIDQCTSCGLKEDNNCGNCNNVYLKLAKVTFKFKVKCSLSR